MFNGLTPIIRSIEDATERLEEYADEESAEELPIMEDNCEVCD
jgi:hypothetical protein|tara:strand:+ start:2531 stop:2659 length:129 start_codon:yes stop_codon:yes gene_type:complete